MGEAMPLHAQEIFFASGCGAWMPEEALTGEDWVLVHRALELSALVKAYDA